MKENLIFAAIALSMISAVAFGQEAAVIDEGVAAVRGATDAGKTAATVGSTATGAAAITGAASSANLINMNSMVTSGAFSNSGKVVTNNVQPGAQCKMGAGFPTLVGADVAAVEDAADHGLINHTDCMNETDHATAIKVVRILTAERNALGSVQNISEATPTQRLAVGLAQIRAIAHEVGISDIEAARRGVLLCEHKDSAGQAQICYSTAEACTATVAAAAEFGVTPANADM